MKNRILLILWLLWMPGGLGAQKFIYVDTLLPEGYVVTSISVVDSQVVWALAYLPYTMRPDNYAIQIIRTIDGGCSWHNVDAMTMNGNIATKIVGLSANEAWVPTYNGKNGVLFKTVNGGRDWNAILTFGAGLQALYLFDSLHVYCHANQNIIIHSSNGGANWQFDTLKTYIKGEYNIESSDPIGDTVWIITSKGRILRSTEYAKNFLFIQPKIFSDSISKIFSIAFSDHKNGLIKYSAITDAGINIDKMARTTDGGFTWQALKSQPNSLCYLLESIWGAPGSYWTWNGLNDMSGRIGRTHNSGESWSHAVFSGMVDLVESGPDGKIWVAGREKPLRHVKRCLLNAVRNLSEYKRDSAIFINLFYTIEKCKALSLWQAKREAEALHWGNIPDDLIQLEKNIRDSIAALEEQQFELENSQLETALKTNNLLSLRIVDLRKTHNNLLYQLQLQYPEYYRRINDWEIANYQEYQQYMLNSDQALIQYLITDSAILLTCLQKEKYFYKIFKKDFPLDQWIAELRHNLTAFHTDANMANSYDSLAAAYTSLAHQLYEKLLAPIADSLPEHLIIVPDGALGYLPFEVLLTAPAAVPTRWQDHAYLLKKHSISYAYSATMLREMTVHPHLQEPKVNFYGFAPRYDGDTSLLSTLFPGTDLRKDLTPLPHTGEEVYKAAKLMGGKYFTGRNASEANFRAKASEARILHLATHGQANDRAGDYCFLVFADQKDSTENEILYARDIYNLQLNADLVTLSACETGIGELQGGEGIISLARAFAYAGAKSIVTSLWSVSDAKTKDLMIDFYKNLRKGMLKDDALRQAKLDFLKRNRGQAAHPFYWAGFVGIGNMGGIR